MFNFLKKLFANDKSELLSILAGGAMILDVRTRGEFAGGHAKGAVNIPLQELQGKLAKVKKSKKPVVAYCRSGNRSSSAVSILKQHGIEAYNAGSLGSMKNLLDMAAA